jgi:hypothetical protein
MTAGNAWPGPRPGRRPSQLNYNSPLLLRAGQSALVERGSPRRHRAPNVFLRGQAARERGRADSAASASSLPIGALALCAGSTVLVALRLLSVARLKPQTADGILQASGAADVIIGTVISLVPSIALISGSCLALNETFQWSPKRGLCADFVIWTSIVALIVATLLTIPYGYDYTPAAIFVILVLVWLFRDKIAKIAAAWNGKAGRIIVRVPGRPHCSSADVRGSHKPAMDTGFATPHVITSCHLYRRHQS